MMHMSLPNSFNNLGPSYRRFVSAETVAPHPETLDFAMPVLAPVTSAAVPVRTLQAISSLAVLLWEGDFERLSSVTPITDDDR